MRPVLTFMQLAYNWPGLAIYDFPLDDLAYGGTVLKHAQTPTQGPSLTKREGQAMETWLRR